MDATPQLVEHDTQETVAKAHNAGPGNAYGRRMNVDFKATLAPILDALLLSFIICEERRRDASRERYEYAARGRAWDNTSALAVYASADAACMTPYSGPGC